MTDTRYDPTPSAGLVEEWLEILLGLFPDGYSRDPDSLRVLELTAWAYLFAFADNVLTQAGEEIHPQSAIDTLEQHEAGLRLPNDAGVSDAERIARIRMVRAMRGITDASLGRMASVLGSIGAVELRGVVRDDMENEPGLPGYHALSCALVVNPADYATPRVRQALALGLERGLDVSRFGPSHVRGSRLLTTSVGVKWESATAADGRPQIFGQTVIDRSSDVTADTASRWTARLREFGPLTRIDPDDIERVILSLALQPSGISTQAPTMAGDLKCCASISIGAGTNVLVEDAGVWINRLLFASGQAAATDIRPGGAAEDGDASRFSVFLDTAAGGVGNVVALMAGVELYADAATGLRIRNTTGATAYVNLFAWSTSPYTGGAVGRTQPFGSLAPGVASLTAATWNAFVAYLGTARGAAAAAWATGELRGVVHRLAMAPHVYAPSGTAPVEVTLDTSIDWRDRFLVVSVCGDQAATGAVVYPGSASQDSGTATDKTTVTPANSTHAFGYTGPGHAAAQTTAGQWDIALSGMAATLRLYADSTTGALVLAIYQFDAPAGYTLTPAVNVIGSFQLGVKVTPSAAAPAIPTATAGAVMRPAQLNVPQDYAIPDYARSTDASQGDLSTIPLGLDVYGAPPIARVSKMRRDRFTGYSQDAAVPLYRRERTDGGVSCWISEALGANTHHVLDATRDWRDRMISRIGSTSIGTNANRSFYSGPGMTSAEVEALPSTGYYVRINTSSALYLYARSSDGALILYIGAGAATVKQIVTGSPHFGGHAVYCATRSSRREPVSIGNLFLWITPQRATVTGSSVRAVPVRDARAGVVHSASAVNGFQSGGTPAAGFTGTPIYPWIGSRQGRGPAAVRIRSEDSTYWSTALSAGTWAFIGAGPSTLAFAFTMVDVGTPYPPRANLTSAPASTTPLLAYMLDCWDGSNNTSGIRIGIDIERGVLSFQRAQNAASTITGNTLASRTKVRDGLPHYVVIRTSATIVELFVDGRLEASAVPVSITQPSTVQPRLSSTYWDKQTEQGYMPQAGFDFGELVIQNVAASDTQLAQIHAYMKSTHRRGLP